MQSIASNQTNISRDEKLMELLSIILLLPQKWKSNNEFSSMPFENVPSNIVNKYSNILEQFFFLPSDSSKIFSLLDKLANSADFINIHPISKNRLKSNYNNSAQEFLLNLLHLSVNFQSIFNFLMKFVSCKSSPFISFFEKIDFSELFIDFLFHKDHLTNKKLFNQIIRLINCLLSNIQIDSKLFTAFFKTHDILKHKMHNLHLDSNSYFSQTYINYETNILYILDNSLLNDSYFGIDLILSIHSRLSISNNFSLYSINHPGTIEKLYRFLGQKINNKQFDKSVVSTILLLTSIMNNIFHQKNSFFDILQKDLPIPDMKESTVDYPFRKEISNEKKDDMEFLSQILNELQFLYNYDEKNHKSAQILNNTKENNNNISEESNLENQYNSNKYSSDSKSNEVFLSGIPPPIYQDGSNNDFIFQKPNSYSPMTSHKSKRNSRFCPVLNKQRKDPHQSICKLAQCDPSCFSLGAIHDEKAIAPLFPSPYKTYQQFDVCTNVFYSQQKFNKFEDNSNQNTDEIKKETGQNKTKINQESNNTTKELSKENNQDIINLNEEIDQPKNELIKKSDININNLNDKSNQTIIEKNDITNIDLNKENEQIKTEESANNSIKEDENENKNETSNDTKEDIHINKKRINHTNLKDKDIQDLVSSTNLSHNIDLNETRARKRTPLIPAIPTKQNQAKTPGRIRSLSSLNNIYGSSSSVNSYEQVESESNSGYSSNYYKASISPSRSFGNVLQTEKKNCNFTVTTGLGTPNRSGKPKNGDNFGIKKRNSLGFISPLKPLFESSQSDVYSSNDLFFNSPSNVIHASFSANQYDDDVFPTTFVESVIPEIANEVNFGKNQSQTGESSDKELNESEENEKIELSGKSSQDQIIDKYDFENGNKNNEPKYNEISVSQNNIENKINISEKIENIDICNSNSLLVDEKNKDDSLNGIYNSPDYFDDMDVTPTPRGSARRLNSKKRPNSSDFVKPKRQRKARTSLPPSTIRFNIQKDDNEISLIDLATSSEVPNLDDFNIDMNRRMNPFSMNKQGLNHSTSGPISRSSYTRVITPFRKSLGSVSKQSTVSEFSPYNNQNSSFNNNNNNLNNENKNRITKPPLSPMQLIDEDSNEKQQSRPFSLDVITDDSQQNQLRVSTLTAINEETDESQTEPPPLLDTISEEIDENQPFLDTITEEPEENQYQQQQQISQMETISEEVEENQPFLDTITEDPEENQQQPFLGTITEEENENQNQMSLLEAITEEAEDNQPFLDTITEDPEENQQQILKFEAISEEAEENQPFLDTITEDPEENQQQISKLETISEEFDENQPFLDTITEDPEENQQQQQQISKLETISEEVEDNQPFLDTITEDPEENQQRQPFLDTIAEEENENHQHRISPLDTITEENEENQLPQFLETISEEQYENQKQYPYPLEIIDEEPDENQQQQQQVSQLETINEEADENQPILDTITEDPEENHQQQQQNSPLETISEEADESRPLLETIAEDVEENQQHASPLEIIAEEPDENQTFLETIDEEADESQKQQISPLETINEEDEKNHQNYCSPLESIAEETDEKREQISPLETINEDDDENQHSQLLDTITENPNENHQISPLDTITEADEENHQNYCSTLESIAEETDEKREQISPLETINEDDDENQHSQLLGTITENPNENPQVSPLETITEADKESQHSHFLVTIAENPDLNPQISPLTSISARESHRSRFFSSNSQESMQSQPLLPTITEERIKSPRLHFLQSSPLGTISELSESNPLRESKNEPHTETVRQIESNLFVSIGVLLANELFIEDSTRFFQNSVCLYLSSLDSCTGLFDKIMSESNLIMQVLNSEKENRIKAGNENRGDENEEDDEDKNDSLFSFDCHENMKDNFGRISKIINNNHDSIPSEFKNQWNEYMSSVIKTDEGQRQTSEQSFSSCPQLD